MTGTPMDMTPFGSLGGNDELAGDAGDDLLDGGAGNDKVMVGGDTNALSTPFAAHGGDLPLTCANDHHFVQRVAA